ncbi:FMN-dependent oxidoreductase (nitrilotriacetate monooxygenase family) [Ancylobacter aquaticus]|uniref:FMN-dependent oxidoreductase (Nitrilotriacetate monooxygenase family) n=1 Tax=Ancylobacter aquaticus TaxID=100 RepID=A0A4R1I4V8_ANCAQ|nr:LLM class flavin-dependent oxidoreductase [Ancylobacter aquaticus]TCK30364.1 FMN-dependent oxidoreductase (nitrilotriacetate monooxygenase family) [Ancylobacter aquaticus]
MSNPKQMHLCGFMVAGPVVHSHAIWRNPAHETPFLTLPYYADIARTLERGMFDFVFFADRLAISDRYGDSHEIGIGLGDQDATRMDPMPILGAMASVTTHLGLGATRSTTYDAPFNLAREFATLDHLSGGRAAWNVVTSMNDGEALNFGLAAHLGHDERYDRADEFLDVAFKLWDSWDADALILDRARGLYADPGKVHYANHAGTFFRSRGPLNIPRSPQGRPVIIQAGSSGRGKAFAAKWSEVIFALQPSLARMAAFKADVVRALEVEGRAPDAAKVMMAIMPFIGKTRAEAEAKRDLHDSLVDPRVGLSTLAAHANADFGSLPLDATIDEIADTGSKGNLAALRSIAGNGSMTIAEAGRIYGRGIMCPRAVGTARDVADELIAIIDSGAADGFVISPAFLPDTFEDFVNEVVPLLQASGRLRSSYAEGSLRERLAGAGGAA